MTIRGRRDRERAHRHQLIVAAARELAETEGWEAVTTRRLAERIEYSQPVLYSHFANKDAIVTAVALEGFAELASALRKARMSAATPAQALAAVAAAYAAFAHANPALFEAMFLLPTDLPFGRPEAPRALHDGFDEVRAVFAPLAGGFDKETFTELGWSAIHGLVVLDRSGRLRPNLQDERLAMLVGRFGSARGHDASPG